MSRAKPRHGTLSGYRNLKCRCEPCREAHYRWRKRNKVLGTTLVDAQPAREHIYNLINHGWNRAEIARYANVSPGLVKWLADDNTRRRTHADKARRILQLTPNRSGLNEPPSKLGTARRIQALIAIGWRQIDLAALLGTSQAQVHCLAVARHRAIQPGTAERVAALYDELSMTHGPSRHAACRAIARGWAPPLAWDNIDDPNAIPAPTRTDKHIATEDIVELIDDLGYTHIAAARQLGMDPRAVERRYLRAKKKAA